MADETNTALELRASVAAPLTARAPLEWTPEQLTVIRNSIAKGATPEEFALLIETAKALRLDPLQKQIHFVKRRAKEGDQWIDVWATQTGIDGFRSIAEDTGLYDGQDEPELVWRDQINPKTGEVIGRTLDAVKVRVYRKDISRPFYGIAYYDEFVQRTKDGTPTKMWAEKPRTMLSKCAEAQSFRKAFPQKLSKVYAPEEMPDGPTPAERMSAAPAPAQLPAPATADRLEDALRRIRDVTSTAAADALAVELGKVAWSKPERTTVGGAFKAKRKELEAKALPAPSACDVCGQTGSHQFQCPNDPEPTRAAEERQPGEEG